jgi:molecular chaperone DnaJ
MKTHICPQCRRSGKRNCPNCKGTGEKWNDESFFSGYIKCGRCKGGKTIRCIKCGGTGIPSRKI